MNGIEIAVSAILIPLGIWIIRTLLEVEKAVVQVRTVLIGIDGQNGIRSQIRAVSEQQDVHEHRITLLEAHHGGGHA